MRSGAPGDITEHVQSVSDAHAESLQSCPTLRLRGPYLSGFCVHGILLARALEWVAVSFSIDIYKQC